MQKIAEPDSFAPFLFSTPGYSVRARGRMRQVGEDEALEVARKIGSGVVGMVPFSPGEPAYLVVPEHLDRGGPLVGRGHTFVAPDRVEGVDSPGFRAAVGEAVTRMNRGELDKVVLARLLRAHYAAGVPAPEDIFETLLVMQPRAYVFSARLPDGESYLMGGSPELVLGSRQGEFTTFPLAGTAARTATVGSAEDTRLGEDLLRSAKDLHEHATVVDDIRRRLEPVTEQLTVPASPQLLATPQLWHLATRITGRLAAGMSSLDGARAIHPTPAICGYPAEKALEVIGELEDFDRGYFGGLIGWMDTEGNGEWALVLRCARVGQGDVTLFAGAGIVKDSVPDREHTETANKLGSFGRVLGISTL